MVIASPHITGRCPVTFTGFRARGKPLAPLQAAKRSAHASHFGLISQADRLRAGQDANSQDRAIFPNRKIAS